ncbi:MAG: type II secretion system F family protein [Planctomycetes bacterium]|nr:type II secretion system F family protein [Planctomycetota bacterium]
MILIPVLYIAFGLILYVIYLSIIASRRRAADRVLSIVADTVELDLPLLQVLVYALDEASLWERPMMRRLTSDLADGFPLDEALGRCSSVMPPLVVSQVGAGLRCGRLKESLRAAVKTQEHRAVRHAGWFAPILYLTLLAACATVFATLHGSFFYPRYRRILDDFGASWNPVATLVGGSLSSLVGLLAVVGIAAIVLSLPLMAKGRASSGKGLLANVLDRIRWTLPGWRGSERAMGLAAASRQMALALEAGATDTEALDQAAELQLNVVMRRQLARVAEAHREGQASLAASFAAAGGFPRHFLWTLATGEAAGNLPLALGVAAEQYEAQSEKLKEFLFHFVQVSGIVLIALFASLQALAWVYVWRAAVTGAMGR